MKKMTLAALSVATLLALSGCCKKKETTMKQEKCMKKDDCCKKKVACQMDKCGNCPRKHKGKMCDEKKSAYHSYLELQEADEVLL